MKQEIILGILAGFVVCGNDPNGDGVKNCKHFCRVQDGTGSRFCVCCAERYGLLFDCEVEYNCDGSPYKKGD